MNINLDLMEHYTSWVSKIGSPLTKPKFSACYSSGSIISQIVPRLSKSSAVSKGLLNGITNNARMFQRNIRKYNSFFLMASVTSNCFSPSVGSSGLNPSLTIQGQLHHFVRSLKYSEMFRPRYLSNSIYDSLRNELERANYMREDFPGVSNSIPTQLGQMLQSGNSSVYSFLSKRLSCQGTAAHHSNRLLCESAVIERTRDTLQCSYGFQSCCYFIGSDADHIHRNDIILRSRNAVNENENENFSALHYRTENTAPCFTLFFLTNEMIVTLGDCFTSLKCIL